MIRINLIPPEILATRRDERRWQWVWVGGGVLAAIVVMFYLVMVLQVAGATSDVASVQQQAQQLQAQTARFDVFEQKESDLKVRQDAVKAAMAGRVDWQEMLFELGLVLPRDVYLTTFSGVDAGTNGSGSTVSLAGVAVPDSEDTPGPGYKSIAKVLVRLTEMPQLDSVWLSSAALSSDALSTAPTYDWSVNAKITPVATQTVSSGQ